MVYNYTKPRGRIAAMDSSPGPCYGLPSLVGCNHHDPRSVYSKGPAYPFGIRHTHAHKDESGPGPVYLPDRKTYRTGRDGTPHYSLSGRPRESQGFSTPGPGAYYPENSSNRIKSAPPAYSLSSRYAIRERSDTPGPNVYRVPSVIGRSCLSAKRQAPSYSLSGRCTAGAFDEDLRKTPGPGSYGVSDIGVYKSRTPQFSVTGRVKPPLDDSAHKPGPGAHFPEKTWAHKRDSPHFSFGIRHSQYASTLMERASNDL